MKRLKLTVPAMAIALLVSWPALNKGLIQGSLSMQSMLMRLGLSLVFGMAAVAVVSSVVDAYRVENAMRRRREEAARRRLDDEPARHV